jgi:hypothetical protein
MWLRAPAAVVVVAVMRLVLLGLIVAISACATSLQDIRERAPLQTGDFPRPYQALARCVFDRLDAQIVQGGFPWSPSASPLLASLPDFLYRLDDPAQQRRARVSATSPGPPASAMFEITVAPTAAGTSHVEYRRGSATSGSVDRAAWQIVTACGHPG